MLEVKLLTPADRARWDRFVLDCPAATFFHRAGWEELVGGVLGHRTWFLYAERDGEICGVLPLAQVKSLLFGNSMTSLPFCVYGGVASMDVEASEALEAEAERLAREMDVAYLEYRNVSPHHADWPTQDIYATFRMDLAADEAGRMKAIPSNRRNKVRRGIKAGLSWEIDQDVERLFPLYADNVHRHGTPPFSRRYLERIKEVFGDDCDILIVIDAEGVPVSGMMSFFFRGETMPYYAGENLRARDTAANDYKYWALMARAAERGCTVFDCGRSKQGTGAYVFKNSWGFTAVPLHYEYRLYKRDSVPQNNPSNPKYKLFIEAWQRMPIGLANWLGPYIVRNLG
ncbi:MAG: FemAB family PEP-CTERM system-associated protein [Rhodocyclaceae bacterium]|nr:FemAB family PEP-CTERM system-associated protein [Rhodocyclaceae bacterium]